MRNYLFLQKILVGLLSGLMAGISFQLVQAAEPPSATEVPAAKAGNEIEKAIGPDRPTTKSEFVKGVVLGGIKNPAQAIGTHRVALKASSFVYLKDRNLLVTTMTKDQIEALPVEPKTVG